eukprot:gene4948-5189_t
MRCSFTVSYVGQQPLPGNISAKVTAAGTLVPYTARAPQVRYQFSGAKVLNVGSIAKVSNFFEQGPGIMQPFGVSGGLQPPPDMNLEDSRQFNYLAMFGNTESAKCGNRWQVVNSAELQASTISGGSDTPGGLGGQPVPIQQRQQQVVVVGVDLIGCVTLAPAGAILCGGGVCAPGQRCYDGWNCCSENIQICGGICCDGGRAGRSAVTWDPQPVELTRRLVANTLRRLPAFSPQDLAMTLIGLPQLSPELAVSPYHTVHKLAAAAALQLDKASPAECVLLFASLAKLNYQADRTWLSHFWSKALKAALHKEAQQQAEARRASARRRPAAKQQLQTSGGGLNRQPDQAELVASRLLWSLAKLGYRPAGGLLPDWLQAALLAPPGSSSTGSSRNTGGDYMSMRLAAAGAAGVLATYNHPQLRLLLLGLRGTRAAPGSAWLLGLLQYSQVTAADWSLEVGHGFTG